ncbi:uncharacterized protein LOC111278792 isoform X1 [Durio zibethinus]|uniref:Uncharacterized protein LOC111278792 isoform X1 n=1 Tax=Durio zibethinus TaxID=66656 RepID=A0A6P5WZ12_DURZI|nr:uncharacterized protein LOC111278792 isoform X1 [Durio zibethinus]XP_022721168.1 uncharacterized protein LOC111278792 isoform X1 [Durio zibethinus]XP_022721177.1 uncharacterized protein LOC111278792 isoform X1 [Durio zibethinus]
MNLSCVLPLSKLPNYLVPITFPGSFSFLDNYQANPRKSSGDFWSFKDGKVVKRKVGIVRGWLLPVDPWAPNIDSENIASQLFAVSLFPYIGFLYFITKSKSAPKLTLFGFYFLLAFVGATVELGCKSSQFCPNRKEMKAGKVPAGIYAKVKFGTSLSNVDWLHGGAESLLTLTNLFIVLGLRQALRKADDAKERTSSSVPNVKKQKKPYV